MRNAVSQMKRRVKAGMVGLGLLVALTMGSSPVFGQVSGNTDIDISFPPLIILFYFGNVDVNITAANLEALVLAGANPVDVGIGTGSGFSTDLNVDTTVSFTSPTALNLDLLRSWGIRAISNGGNQVQVAVSLACPGCDTTLEHNTVVGDDIEISSAAITSPTGGAFGGTTVNVTPTGLVNAITGDIRLVLDLTDANTSGDYLDGVFEISAVSL